MITVKEFGALGDGITDDTIAINAALNAAALLQRAVFVPSGTYAVTSTLIVPAGVRFYGVGRGSLLASSIPDASGVELVRLSGDYAAIETLRLRGTGQGDGSVVSGARGIWIGAGDYLTRSDYCRVEACLVEQFKGNGISGDYFYATIANDILRNNTDANLFVQPTSSYNFIQGNTITGSRYSGIDCNGSHNRIIGNYVASNGTGGQLDANSRHGILVANISNATPAEYNIIAHNRVKDNGQCGVVIFGSTGESIAAARGNMVTGNIVSGHATVAGLVSEHIPAGIAVWGGDDTTIEGNTCFANRDNYVVAGAGNATACNGTSLIGNKSIDATRHGYHFIFSPRVDLAGDFPPLQVTVLGNTDRGAAGDSFKFQAAGRSFDQFTIAKNRSRNAGGYAFHNASPMQIFDYHFDDNYASGFATAYQTGFDSRNLHVNSGTPDVTNGRIFKTQNSSPTTMTNFSGGIAGQQIAVLVNDANTTFDFTGTNLKGNGGVDFAATSGDFLTAWYDGTNWYCSLHDL